MKPKMKNNIRPRWFGTLAIDNVEQVAAAIETVLADKSYTFVACNELFDFRPEVRTGQRLKKSNPVHTWIKEEKYAGLSVSDTYGVWGFSTNAIEDVYDPTFNNPYIVLDHGKLTVTHRALAGHLIYWCAAVEGETR